MNLFKELFRKAQAANHFNIAFTDGDWKKEWLDIFSNQVEWIEINLTNQFVSIGVRQLADGYIQDLIMHILKSEFRKIDEARVYPLHNRSYEYVFSNGALINHRVKFDYNDRSPVIHELVFDFEEVKLHSKRTNDNPLSLSTG
jgi:hypothetical protein